MNPSCPACGSQIPAAQGLCPSCLARSLTPLLLPGTGLTSGAPEIPGYQTGELIGQGGMGVVYRGTRISDGTPVAIKVMAAELSGDDDLSERFAREIDTLTALDHPHLLRILDSGLTNEGRWFLVTELAEGGDLAGRLRHGPLPIPEALRIFREVADAVGEAHQRGIAHRDIKPANILLTTDGSVRVGDFSLAKFLPGTGPGIDLTRSTEVFGTPYYIAPEVRRGAANVDERADIFSLGVLLHEMLTGRLPIGKFEPAPRYAGLIERCLRENPERRPANTRALLRGLNSRKTLRLQFAAVVIALGAVVLALLPWKRPSPVMRPKPAAATASAPWQNSLGMKFVPLPETGILISVWETRRRDFEPFADTEPRANAAPNHAWRTVTELTPDHPVQPVSMLIAAEFCRWLTRTEQSEGVLPPGLTYRLPTDEEWSRAALLPAETGKTPRERDRALSDEGHAPYVWGRSPIPPADVAANYAGQERPGSRMMRHRDPFPGIAPVGSFQANAIGIQDLAGNVAEWCSTPWAPDSNLRVLRGGAWFDSERRNLRLDARESANPGAAPNGAGFRVVLDLGK
jgi:serine/threonine protein kinase